MVAEREASRPELELGRDAKRRIAERVAQGLRRRGALGRLGRRTGEPRIVAHVDREPTEPASIVEAPDEGLGVPQIPAHAVELGEREQGVAQIEAHVDGRLEGLAGLRQPRHRLQRLLEARHGVAIGGQPHGPGPGLAEADQRLLPHLARAVVPGQRRVVPLGIGGVEILEGLRHQDVQPFPPRMDELVVHDLANPLVGEVELLAEALQHAPAHQLLHSLGGVPFVEPGRPLEERELELAADDGGHRCEVPASVAQAFQTAGHDAADALGKRERRRRERGDALLDRPDGLDHQKGVARARAPDLRIQPGIGAGGGRADQ